MIVFSRCVLFPRTVISTRSPLEAPRALHSPQRPAHATDRARVISFLPSAISSTRCKGKVEKETGLHSRLIAPRELVRSPATSTRRVGKKLENHHDESLHGDVPFRPSWLPSGLFVYLYAYASVRSPAAAAVAIVLWHCARLRGLALRSLAPFPFPLLPGCFPLVLFLFSSLPYKGRRADGLTRCGLTLLRTSDAFSP